MTKREELIDAILGSKEIYIDDILIESNKLFLIIEYSENVYIDVIDKANKKLFLKRFLSSVSSGLKTMSTPLTFGELKVGEHFVCFPTDGDDSGHGGFRSGSYVFAKIEPEHTLSYCLPDNSIRIQDGIKTHNPDTIGLKVENSQSGRLKSLLLVLCGLR